MAATTVKHFDYLVDFDADLESALGLSDLSKDINHWRCFGMDYPDTALVGCRKVMEAALRTLADPLPDDHMGIKDVIDYAYDEDIIDRSMSLKCHEIRVKGNKGAHEYESVKAIDAQMTLDLLDDFLRWCAESLLLIPADSSNAIPNDPIFIVKPEQEVAAMSRTAKLAAALSEDKGIEKRAQKAKGQAAAFNDSSSSDLDKMAELIRQAEEIGASAAARQDVDALTAHDRLLDQCDKNLESLKTEKASINKSIDDINVEISEILSEHDFIKKLLQGDKRATEKQLEVMAFPRGSGSVTNILQIAGGAGTGKTLCLLAKIIAEIDDHGQESLFDEPKKTALFICFNKGLANYVRSILAGYEGDAPKIEVAHYDEFINQLVRKNPKAGYEHLAEYACDVRYERSRIIYGFDESYLDLLKSAQKKVAEHHPERSSDYYLNSANEEELDWLKDELIWIDARFSSEEDAVASYPKAERIGRGTKHRPNEGVRLVILEVWQELNRLIAAQRRYTIEQATKRLLKSNSLPKYDAIAIDEIQDFSLLSVRLLLRFRRSDHSKVFLSGDENQKIYRRDFTWKELDEGLRAHTITLRENMRNSAAIRRFSDRLLGIDCPYENACRFVHIQNADDKRTVELIRKLSNPNRHETTALISNKRNWIKLLRTAGIAVMHAEPGDICNPGLYLLGDRMGKGLEFDNVIVDYAWVSTEDDEEEKRLRYVHFTRARKRLYIRYQGIPPKLLSEHYADFLD